MNHRLCLLLSVVVATLVSVAKGYSAPLEVSAEIKALIVEEAKKFHNGGNVNNPSTLDEAIKETEYLRSLLFNIVDASTQAVKEGGGGGGGGEHEAAQVVEMDTLGNVSPPVPCSAYHSCNECISNRCAWCLADRACRPDEVYQCQGEVDHVGLSPIGRHRECPRTEDIERIRQERKRRKEEAKKALLAQAAAAAAAAAAGDKDDDTLNSGREGSTRKSAEERLNDLRQRAKLAENNFGKTSPYETLGVETTASSGEIRKAYRRLSLIYHPDKNPSPEVHELAEAAFKDIVAAFEIIGDPEKRAIFDDFGQETLAEAFTNEESYMKYGQKNENNFYQGNRLITALTEKLWERRVGMGDDVWIVEFYAPWCGACQSLIGEYKRTAELLADETGIEVGAVNCIAEPHICNEWFAIRAYPTILAINDKHGTRQEYHTGSKDAASVAAWAREVAKEWRWLFAKSRLSHIVGDEAFNSTILSKNDFAIVAFMDGIDCSACKTAKTNMMRLSAGLRAIENVTVSIVDCSEAENKHLCYQTQMIPAPPHAPVVKGYASGVKSQSSLGEILYNTNELEPHLAMEIMERIVRLSLNDRIPDPFALTEADDDDASKSGYARDKKEEDKKKKDEPPPKPQWNGPPPKQAIRWGGDMGTSRQFVAIGHG